MKHFLFILLSGFLLLNVACRPPKAVVKQEPVLALSSEDLTAISSKHTSMDHVNDLNAFLKEVKTDVESHNWGNIFAKCNKKHYKTQAVKLKMEPAHYLSEIFGLNSVESDLTPNGKAATYEDLNKIKEINYDKMDYDGNWITVTGKVKLADGSELKLRMQVHVLNGKYELIGAVG